MDIEEDDEQISWNSYNEPSKDLKLQNSPTLSLFTVFFLITSHNWLPQPLNILFCLYLRIVFRASQVVLLVKNPGVGDGQWHLACCSLRGWKELDMTELLTWTELINAGVVRNAGSITGSERSPEGRHGNPLSYSCLENPKERGSWQATVHRITKCWTWLKWLSKQASTVFQRRTLIIVMC